MKRLILAIPVLFSTAAFAQAPQTQTFVLSAPLVEELLHRMSMNGLIAMLQAEVQHQPPPVTCPDARPPIAVPPPKVDGDK